MNQEAMIRKLEIPEGVLSSARIYGAWLDHADWTRERTQEIFRCLSEERQDYSMRYRSAGAFRQSVAAGWLLEEGFRAWGLQPPYHYEIGAEGKPFLKGRELCFSLSHSGRFAAVVLSDVSCGIDVEDKERRITPERRQQIARRFFLENEQDSPFLSVWTRKEAYAKAVGIALPKLLKQFDTTKTEASGYRFWQLDTEQFFLSLCAAGLPEEHMAG